MKKLIVIFALVGMTGLNVLFTTPWSTHACSCYVNGQKICDGDCCVGDGTRCECYDKGADDCKALEME
jgi:hypothetical protein